MLRCIYSFMILRWHFRSCILHRMPSKTRRLSRHVTPPCWKALKARYAHSPCWKRQKRLSEARKPCVSAAAPVGPDPSLSPAGHNNLSINFNCVDDAEGSTILLGCRTMLGECCLAAIQPKGFWTRLRAQERERERESVCVCVWEREGE